MYESSYRWRHLTRAQRDELLEYRKSQLQPWHSPPHRAVVETSCYHLVAACYEHRPWIGASAARMDAFAADLLDTLKHAPASVVAWCVLPNHYHALIETNVILRVLRVLGQLHGRTSHRWNGEDQTRGRKTFYRTVERAMRSERHYWATLNYVLHNPVHHGYVEQWTDWPWSNAVEYLAQVGRETAEATWREFPVRDYGKGWDDAEM